MKVRSEIGLWVRGGKTYVDNPFRVRLGVDLHCDYDDVHLPLDWWVRPYPCSRGFPLLQINTKSVTRYVVLYSTQLHVICIRFKYITHFGITIQPLAVDRC